MSAAVEKMRREGLPDIAIETFADYERRLREGEQGTLPESEIEPLDDLPDAAELPEGGDEALDRVVVLKLNGGLGTSMGMTRAKSLLEVKDGLSFLDIIVRQVLAPARADRRAHAAAADEQLRHPGGLAGGARALPGAGASTCRSTSSRARCRSCSPTDSSRSSGPPNPALEWAPPGHGDVYTSLPPPGCSSELLDARLPVPLRLQRGQPRRGARAAHPRLVRARGAAVPVGGDRPHRGATEGRAPGAPPRDGGLVLRETPRRPDEDMDAFQDTTRHRFFNCNTIWLDLRALARRSSERDGVLGLPMIVNRKTVDPTDPSSPAVIQLETAMGAAIDVFEGAAALHVPRSRFAPVKTTNELLALRSDAYVLADDWTVRLAPRARRRRPARRARPRLLQAAARLRGALRGRAAVAGAASGWRWRAMSLRPRVVVRGLGAPSRDRRRIEDGAVLEG